VQDALGGALPGQGVLADLQQLAGERQLLGVRSAAIRSRSLTESLGRLLRRERRLVTSALMVLTSA
jgi:hypothetical protein